MKMLDWHKKFGQINIFNGIFAESITFFTVTRIVTVVRFTDEKDGEDDTEGKEMKQYSLCLFREILFIIPLRDSDFPYRDSERVC